MTEDRVNKVEHWGGENKDIVRKMKFDLMSEAQKNGFICDNPLMLTFAGALAIFEREAVKRKIVQDLNIITVQDCKGEYTGYPAEKILKTLLKTRNENLPGMYVWPSTFSSFVSGYVDEDVRTPPIKTNSAPKWYREEEFREEMNYFTGLYAQPFDILDIDMCGPWSENTGKDIAKLFKNRKLENTGVMFINHLKGRDVRGGTTNEFLKTYFQRRKFINLNKIKETYGVKLDFADPNDDFTLYCFRNILVPLFYITEAFMAGYHLYVDKLVEYSDRNADGQAGTTMFQWMFLFEATDLHMTGLSPEDAEYHEVVQGDNQTYIDNIDMVMREAFSYKCLKKESHVKD